MDKSNIFGFYHDEIVEILNECTHSGDLYYDEFENKISGLWAAAYREGLKEIEFNRILEEIFPNHGVEFNQLFKKAS